jgi:opacity protein-like surface antigen
MKKVFFALLLLSLVATEVGASLLPVGVYVGARGGVGNNKTDTKISTTSMVEGKTNPFASANVGVRFLKLRGELEYIHRFNAIHVAMSGGKKEAASRQIMANLYYDVFDFLFLGFYVNGGVGTNKIDMALVDKYDKRVWSAGFGVDASLLIFTVDLGYRYFDLGSVKILGKNSKQESHDVYLGLRMGF